MSAQSVEEVDGEFSDQFDVDTPHVLIVIKDGEIMTDENGNEIGLTYFSEDDVNICVVDLDKIKHIGISELPTNLQDFVKIQDGLEEIVMTALVEGGHVNEA